MISGDAKPERPTDPVTNGRFRILSLDGGGAKGFYTLGVLHELQALLRFPLHEHFDLIYGTSTGSIIASLIALGKPVDEIYGHYKTHVPAVMKERDPSLKSAALAGLADEIFGDAGFGDVKTRIGVVTTKWDIEKPMIFKGSSGQAHGRHGSFVPGFGVRISDAVQASCSAVPFFDRKTVVTSSDDRIELVDGGYCANNPTLYAIADAISALGVSRESICVLSLGVGVYPEPKPGWKMRFAKKYIASVHLLQKTLEINTQSMDQLRAILFKDIRTVRISDTFEKPEMATDFMEHDLGKLNLLRQRGKESFALREADVRQCFQLSED
jgi:uncharacterized protein